MTNSLMREFHIDERAGRATEDFRDALDAAKEFIASNGCPVSILLVISDGDGAASHHYLWGHPGPADAAVASVAGLKAWAIKRHPQDPVGFVLVADRDGRRLGSEKL